MHMNHLRLEKVGAQVSHFFCMCCSDEPNSEKKGTVVPIVFFENENTDLCACLSTICID